MSIELKPAPTIEAEELGFGLPAPDLETVEAPNNVEDIFGAGSLDTVTAVLGEGAALGAVELVELPGDLYLELPPLVPSESERTSEDVVTGRY